MVQGHIRFGEDGIEMTEIKKGPALRKVSGLIRVLFHRLAHAASQIHESDLITMGQRALLEDLLNNGPQTIPRLASKRPVSRQHILGHVNPLKQGGYVEYQDNPIHKRSFLISLTDKGQKTIRKMIQREDRVFQELAKSLKIDELNKTIEILKIFKGQLEDEEFNKTLNKVRG